MAARRVLATTSSGVERGYAGGAGPIPDPVDEHHGHDGDVEERLWRRRPRGIREQARPQAGRWRR
jgi:hypothetical protein